MKTTYISFLFSLTVICGCKTDSSVMPDPGKFQTKYVIVISVDGPRYVETWGEPELKYIPERYRLSKSGCYLTEMYNLGVTNTNSGTSAITTGVYENVDNSGAQYPSNPSMFQYYLKKTGLNAEKCQVITSKDKLYVLTNCKTAPWNGVYNPEYDCGNAGNGTGYRLDDTTYRHAIKILSKKHPHLSLIQFKEPDVSGHANDWPGYIEGIKNTDKLVSYIWNFLQNDKFYKGKTTLMVSNDHGRHDDGWMNGFINHGDNCNGCRHIELFAIGPDFKKGAVIHNTYEQIDIAATVNYIMNLGMTTGKGKVITDLFY